MADLSTVKTKVEVSLAEALAVSTPVVAVGNRVRVFDANKPNIKVRNTPSVGAAGIGTQPLNAEGVVVGALTNEFWQINFDSGVDGWVWGANVFPIGVALTTVIPKIEASLAEVIAAQGVVQPPPPPPPVVGTIPLTTAAVNANRAVVLGNHYTYEGLSYNRYMKTMVVTGTNFTIPFQCINFGGGARVGLMYPKYELYINNVLRATANVTIGATAATFIGSLGSEPDGPYVGTIKAYDSSGVEATNVTECHVPYCFWIDRNGEAKNHPNIIVQNGSYSWTHGNSLSAYMIVPKATWTPKARPLPTRPTVTHSTSVPQTSLARVALVPNTDAIDQDRHHAMVTRRGITVTENLQGYFPNQMFDRYPKLPLLDGPRGVCTAPMTLTLTPGREGKVYAHSPHSFAVIDSTGFKRTLVGLSHNPDRVPYWDDTPFTVAEGLADNRYILHGDWDPSIPIEKRHPWESWGFGWDKRTLVTDPNAPPIGGEQPHIVGPTGFASCRHGRILRYRFSATDRAAPAKVDEWITGINDPWGLVTTPQNTIIISERGSHRISEWSMDTPNTKIRDILHSPNAVSYGGITAQPRRWSGAIGGPGIAAEDVVAPEGLALVDDWLYYASLAMQEVRRVNLVTGVIEKNKGRPQISYSSVGSYFIDIAVSDGTFFPKFTVWTNTFFNSQYGNPEMFSPNGNSISWVGYGYGISNGPGGTYNGGHYPTALGQHDGRLFTADSGGGIQYFCFKDAYDGPTLNLAAIQAGWEYYRSKGYMVKWGPYTINQGTEPLPWGENANMDIWFRHLGLTP